MNSVIISGHLGNDIELRSTSSGSEYLNNSVAVKRNFKQNDVYETDWIPIKAWGNQAKFIANYFEKGNYIILKGRWEASQKVDVESNKRTTYHALVVDSVEFGPSTKSNDDKPKTKAKERKVVKEEDFDEEEDEVEEDEEVPTSPFKKKKR